MWATPGKNMALLAHGRHWQTACEYIKKRIWPKCAKTDLGHFWLKYDCAATTDTGKPHLKIGRAHV